MGGARTGSCHGRSPSRRSAAHQVERLGFRGDDVRHIVLTHFDADHIGGLSDSPTPRIILVSLPGHTCGHACVAVDAGDAFCHHGTLDGRTPVSAALRTMETLVAFDLSRGRCNHARLAELHRREDPGLAVFSAHGPTLYDRVRADARRPRPLGRRRAIGPPACADGPMRDQVVGLRSVVQSFPASRQIWFFLVVRALAESQAHWWTSAPAVVEMSLTSTHLLLFTLTSW